MALYSALSLAACAYSAASFGSVIESAGPTGLCDTVTSYAGYYKLSTGDKNCELGQNSQNHGPAE